MVENGFGFGREVAVILSLGLSVIVSFRKAFVSILLPQKRKQIIPLLTYYVLILYHTVVAWFQNPLKKAK